MCRTAKLSTPKSVLVIGNRFEAIDTKKRHTEDLIIGLISLNTADLNRGRSWILDF